MLPPSQGVQIRVRLQEMWTIRTIKRREDTEPNLGHQNEKYE